MLYLVAVVFSSLIDVGAYPREILSIYVVPNFRTAGMKQGGCFLLIFVNLVRQERGSIYSYRSVVQENLVLTRMVVQNEKRVW